MRARWRRSLRDGTTIGDLVRLALFAVVLVGLVGGLVVLRWTFEADVEVDRVATTTIKAPRSFTYTSEVLTEGERRAAAQDPSTIQLRLEPSVLEEQVRRLSQTCEEISAIRADSSLSISTRLGALRALPNLHLTEPQVNDILNLPDGEWARVCDEARSVLRRSLERQVVAEEVGLARERLRDWISAGFNAAERSLIAALAGPFVRANVVVDGVATERNRQRAREAVQPVRVTVQQGETIIRDGSIVTAADVEKLEQAGLRDRTPSLGEVTGTFGLVALLVGVLLAYVVIFQPTIWRGRTMLLVGIVIVGLVAGARVFFPLHPLAPYAFPIATAAMLLAALLDAQLAVVVGMVLALTLGLVGDRSLEVVTLYCAMSIGGALVMWRADRSARFITAGLLVAVIGFVVSVTFRLISQNLDWPTLGTLAGLSLANGFLSAGLTFVAFSLLGSLFGITTVLQLLELAHPNQPLLRRLAREAPGTYHHSIVVSSLAENAAELVGADPLFTRVAVYYHDIGKVLRPYFFVENQVNTENVHDELDPRTSAQIILGHVTDGVALARRYRLPRRIIDVIEQHHGTTLVRYFYHRAMERGENVDASAFSYAGPRPQTKEAGIIMLADSVEATVRAQYQSGKLLAEGPEVPGDDVGYPVKPNDKIGQVVDRIINERVVEGQLDDCELTLRDLREIRAAFTAVLSNIYHPRVDYPTMPRATPAPAAATRRP